MDLGMGDIGSAPGFLAWSAAAFQHENQLLDSTEEDRRRRGNPPQNGVKNLKALHGRGVEMGRQRQWRGRFKFMTARAVGALPKLLSETESLLGKEGVLAVFRTPKQCQEEMDALKLPSSDMAKWKIMATEYFDLPEDAGTRNFILCRRS
jgi:16S rRNA G527 N7-methylase RsmG